MDSEFPDEDEEYEMRYADEFELMNELDFDEAKPPILPKGHDVKVKKSLKFGDTDSNHGSRASSSMSGYHTPTLDETTRKRQQDDVFGSLSDDEDLSGRASNPSKKAKNDVDIADTRVPFLDKAKPVSTVGAQPYDYDFLSTAVAPASKSKRYVYRLVPDVPHQNITAHSGQKLYIRMISEDLFKQKENTLLSKGQGKLLKVSIQSLKQQVENENRSKASQVSDEQFEHRLRQLEELDFKQEISTDIEEKATTKSSSDLWVEKYRPKTYLDLLSEENVNRTLLHWLKLWDKAVFNKEVKIRAPKSEDSAKPKWASGPTEGNNKQFDPAHKNKKFEKFSGKPNQANLDGGLKEELDSTGRPLQKIVLISGPPGLGKTTLAHVVALHAGYNPVEMNASDDRNVEAFKLQLEAATQMRSVLGMSSRPNCLIIDEIDGAPAASVSFLVNALQAQETTKDKPAGAGKKKKKGITLVSRPVICICNELYTPSLRPLRQAALVLQFPPTNPSRLAQRLMSISKAHALQTDMSALLALCEKADYDIRSCLATLYFLNTLKRPLRYSDVLNINIGNKDSHKSLFEVWQEIFHIPRPKRRQYIEVRDRDALLPMAPDVDVPLDPHAGETATISARFVNVLQSVYSCGEYDRLMQGVFENYPTIKFKDSYMSSVCTGLDWMCFYDLLNKEIQHTQNYTTYGYLPYAFVGIHFQLAAVLAQKIKFPTAQTEFKTKKTQNESIIASMVQDLKAGVRVTSNVSTIIQEIIPFALPIITPNLRPVSAQLYSAIEKEQIQRVMDVMISYNLTYRQEKTAEGVYRYCLEPNIEQVTTFGLGDGQNSNRRSLTYSVKQMLAREIELEKMRQFESNLGPENQTSAPTAPELPAAAADVEPVFVQPPPTIARSLTLKPKAITESTKAATDFFGRPLRTPTKKKNADGSIETSENDVWYHFKEGYSNAVRRNVKISDFM